MLFRRNMCGLIIQLWNKNGAPGKAGQHRPKKFDEEAITLVVIAHIRHTMTPYEELLCQSTNWFDVRVLIAGNIDEIVEHWSIFPWI